MTSSKDELTPLKESRTSQTGLDDWLAKVFDKKLRVGPKPGGRHES
jgi:hypothetical protein